MQAGVPALLREALNDDDSSRTIRKVFSALAELAKAAPEELPAETIESVTWATRERDTHSLSFWKPYLSRLGSVSTSVSMGQGLVPKGVYNHRTGGYIGQEGIDLKDQLFVPLCQQSPSTGCDPWRLGLGVSSYTSTH